MTPEALRLPHAAALAATLMWASGCDREVTSRQEPVHVAAATEAVDQSGTVRSLQGHYEVVFTPRPNPIPFQELFEVEVAVRDPSTGTPVGGARLDRLEAVMPAHGHGMKVEPEIASLGSGIFRVTGVRFHMQGEKDNGRWVFEATVSGPAGPDVARHEVQCCQLPDQP